MKRVSNEEKNIKFSHSLIISIYIWCINTLAAWSRNKKKGRERKILYNLFCCRLSLDVIMLLEFLYIYKLFSRTIFLFFSHPFHLTFAVLGDESDGIWCVRVSALINNESHYGKSFLGPFTSGRAFSFTLFFSNSLHFFPFTPLRVF